MSKSEQIRRFYDFDRFRVDSCERVLLRDGQPVTLAPKLFDTLLALVERSGHIVEKAELMEKVWPGTFVEESNLSSSVSLLRKTLGTDKDGCQYIETVPRRGYRFSPTVEVREEDSELMLVRHTRMRVVTREEEEDSGINHHPESKMLGHEGVSSSETVGHSTGRGKWNKRVITVLPITALILVLAAFLGLKYLRREKTANTSVGPFVNVKMERHTTSGSANAAAISPDGKYLVHVMDRGGQRSLRLKHIPTSSEQEIIPPSPDALGGLTFSPDGNHIYFVRLGKQSEASTLFRVPVLGGAEKQLLRDIDTPISFSPDGSRFTFMRGVPSRRERQLLVAKSDGTEEQIISTHRLEDRFLVGPAWSPDGETIVFPDRGLGADESYGNLVEIRLKDRTEKPITRQKWSSIAAVCWLRDGRGLITIAAQGEPGANLQIWHVAYPSGSVRRITNDLTDYSNLSLTSDASVLAAVQFERTSNIWVAPDNDSELAVQITDSNHDGVGGLAWTPDGRIVFASGPSTNSDLWIMNRDGGDKKQLTEQLSGDPVWNARPTVSPDGRYIVFVSGGPTASHVWRIDIDGRNRKQLTFGGGEVRAGYTPDGKWVVYTSLDTQTPTIWKVPIDGGTPVQLTNYHSQVIAISPKDGQIAYVFDEQRENSPVRRVGVIPLEGGSSPKVFDFPFPFGQNVSWSPNGQALMYLGVPPTNIWSQPINGGPPKQITTFKSYRLLSFAWSHDGKYLAVTRGERTGDLVLIRDQR